MSYQPLFGMNVLIETSLLAYFHNFIVTAFIAVAVLTAIFSYIVITSKD